MALMKTDLPGIKLHGRGKVRDMSATTQFIVITHSKRTMETASQLYGVTMEEPGISKIVSVRLN